jgi:peptide/nickel transport system permease protein
MTGYLARRVFSGLVTLFLFISLVFFGTQAILPGDFVSQYALFLSPDEAEEMRLALGLDLPLGERYLHWLGQLLRGDLGRSFSIEGMGQPVGEVILQALPATLLVFGLGTLIAFGAGQWLGRVTAWRSPRWFSGTATLGAIALYTSFPPWLAFLLVYLFVLKLRWLPLNASRGIFRQPEISHPEVIVQMLVTFALAAALTLGAARLSLRLPRRWRPAAPVQLVLLLALWMGAWQALGMLAAALEVLRAAALPILIYALLSFGEIMLIVRATMADSLNEQFIQTALAKGLRSAQVRDHHAARAAILPVVSRLVISLPFLFTGMVMIEQTVGWSGMGTTLLYALGVQNVPLMSGMFIAIGLVSLGARLGLDLLQLALDPRLRVPSAGRTGLL